MPIKKITTHFITYIHIIQQCPNLINLSVAVFISLVYFPWHSLYSRVCGEDFLSELDFYPVAHLICTSISDMQLGRKCLPASGNQHSTLLITRESVEMEVFTTTWNSRHFCNVYVPNGCIREVDSFVCSDCTCVFSFSFSLSTLEKWHHHHNQ